VSLLGKTILVGFFTAIGALSVGLLPMRAAAAASSEVEAQVRKRILVLYDEDKDELPGLARMDRTLRDSFRAELGKAVEIHSESLDLSGFERPGYDLVVADFYRRKYAGSMPDLIVAVLEPSLDFLLRHEEALFPGVPIVFFGVDAATIAGKVLPANVTGVLVKRTFSSTLDVALRLLPETRNVFVVGGTSTFDRYLQTFVRRDLQPFEGRVDINYLFGLSMEEWLKRLSSLPAQSVILYVTVFSDGTGRGFIPHQAVSEIAAAANAPAYVFVDQYVGLGPVGGNVYSFDTHGVHAAELGMKILRGASPASLPIRELGAQVNLFDSRQLRRWNLDEARLPPDSVVLFKPPSLWAQYRWYVVGALVLILLQTATIVGLIVQRSHRQRAELEALQQRTELAHVGRVSLMGELAASLAHELGQPLTAIYANAYAALRSLEQGQADPKELRNVVEDLIKDQTRAAEVIRHMRRLSRKEEDLQFVPVDLGEIIGEVETLVRTEATLANAEIVLEIEQGLSPVSGDRVQLQQVVLNLLLNALDAVKEMPKSRRTVVLRVEHVPDMNRVAVRDRGLGLATDDPERVFEPFYTTKREGLGMGLSICRSIIRAHGGNLWAQNDAEGGATFYFTVPVRQG
jgi:signal transduction histidine kinase